MLLDRLAEYARTTIQNHWEPRCQSNKRNGPVVDELAPTVGGRLPYAVGCPAFTRELRQVFWPKVLEKHYGKLNRQGS